MEHNGVTKKHFLLHGIGLAARITGSSTQYFHYDTRGSTVLLTNDQGTPTKKYLYDENGLFTKTKFSPLDNRYCFVGQYGVEYEDHNLMYMRKRYYHPKIGRFLSEDPIWSTNLYPYADNNPINRIDPNGTDAISTINNFVYGEGFSLYKEGSLLHQAEAFGGQPFVFPKAALKSLDKHYAQ